MRDETTSNGKKPKVAIIGGSGLGEALTDGTSGGGRERTTHDDIATPFGKPSGPISEITVDGVEVLLLQRHGPGHLLGPSQVPYRANIFALKQLGATHVIASGAVGSLRDDYKPRDLVIVDQAIDKTFRRPGTFYENAAVHVEFSEPFCPVLRRLMLEASSEVETQTHDGGCYVCMEGPQFSTRAESHLHRLWGGDLIGMTLLPEAKLAREAELPYAAVCLVTDYDCWKPYEMAEGTTPLALLQEIMGHLKDASANALALIKATISRIDSDRAALWQCPASSALALGIWSDKSKIDPAEIERLGPLWGKYFQEGSE